MNKKGFTLIELLMVIILIGILSLILMPNIISMINKNNDKSCENFKKSVISATKMYVAENKYDLGFTCSTNVDNKYITLETLVDAGNLSEPVKDPKTKEEINLDDINIKVIYNCDNKTFEYDAFYNNEQHKEKIELDCEK